MDTPASHPLLVPKHKQRVNATSKSIQLGHSVITSFPANNVSACSYVLAIFFLLYHSHCSEPQSYLAPLSC